MVVRNFRRLKFGQKLPTVFQPFRRSEIVYICESKTVTLICLLPICLLRRNRPSQPLVWAALTPFVLAALTLRSAPLSPSVLSFHPPF
ncbi:unnamed protein product [Brassica rapa subsp. trilocularis]